MKQSEFSYDDLVTQINEMAGHTTNKLLCSQSEPYNLNELKKLICLENQFYHVIQFPTFKTIYISPSVHSILGYNTKELTLRKLFNLIHPDDYNSVLLDTKKMYEFVIENYDNIQPLKNVLSISFRMQTKDGQCILFLNQNCLLKKDRYDKTFKVLCLHTDISDLLHKTETEYNLNAQFTNSITNSTNLCNPNELTLREKEILTLLALGNNSREIGEKLNISKHTVDTHRRKMLSKTKLNNTTELVAFSISHLHLID